MNKKKILPVVAGVLPFFWNALLGYLFYAVAFFGIFRVVTSAKQVDEHLY